ncbi:replication protein A 14 kDa subunit isoform X1 [Brachionichthys hirsutus]|uniref:replication protein A 14 kDa subunit isoform X1 n=1 Tax=Brachionichthys hirsutus TaxID=412623 RepID=UPI003605021C
MEGVLDVPKPRINCALLARYVGKVVCFVGRVDKVQPSGRSFTVTDGEGKVAAVELSEPLEQELSGVVEIVGKVSSRGDIMATEGNILPLDKGVPFDLQLYDEALRVIHDFCHCYPFQLAASG